MFTNPPADHEPQDAQDVSAQGARTERAARQDLGWMAYMRHGSKSAISA